MTMRGCSKHGFAAWKVYPSGGKCLTCNARGQARRRAQRRAPKLLLVSATGCGKDHGPEHQYLDGRGRSRCRRCADLYTNNPRTRWRCEHPVSERYQQPNGRWRCRVCEEVYRARAADRHRVLYGNSAVRDRIEQAIARGELLEAIAERMGLAVELVYKVADRMDEAAAS